MALAMNLLALLLVVGLCWAAMVWYSGRFHRSDPEAADPVGPGFVDTPLGGRARIEPGAPAATTTRAVDCAACEGSGAARQRGRLSPCPACDGTGTTAG